MRCGVFLAYARLCLGFIKVTDSSNGAFSDFLKNLFIVFVGSCAYWQKESNFWRNSHFNNRARCANRVLEFVNGVVFIYFKHFACDPISPGHLLDGILLIPFSFSSKQDIRTSVRANCFAAVL
ncbi:hypothetical protein Tcan_01539, partial [Toxocara canis]